MVKKKVVIVDQDRESALAFAAALNGSALSLQLVHDDGKFFEQIEGEPPDLVVLRAEMDRQSGYSICNRLRSGDKAANFKVIIVALKADDRLASHRASHQAADAYVSR